MYGNMSHGHVHGTGGGSTMVHSHIRTIVEKLPTTPLCIWCLTQDELIGIGLQCL